MKHKFSIQVSIVLLLFVPLNSAYETLSSIKCAATAQLTVVDVRESSAWHASHEILWARAALSAELPSQRCYPQTQRTSASVWHETTRARRFSARSVHLGRSSGRYQDIGQSKYCAVGS